MKNIASDIYSVIASKGGIRGLLSKFSTNIKRVAHRAIEQQQQDLSEKGITVQREFPDVACLVFGEATVLLRILQNLIENVWKNSGANLLVLRTTIVDDNSVIMNILDNGTGID